MKQTITLTFSESVENHTGMEIIGVKSDTGISAEKCIQLAKRYNGLIYDLSSLIPEETKEACVVVLKDGLKKIFGIDKDKLYEEQASLEVDKKAFMYGRVVNKHARHNLCFGEAHQAPNYEEGMGTVYAFDEVPLLKKIRCGLGEISGEKGTNLQAEGNYYYDVKKCGIGFHGDTERKKVIAFRLGAKIPLCYAWYHDNEVISDVITIDNLEHGDMYVMSEKTTGFDWKSKTKYTLRHAAGCEKYTTI
jgi:hypothetical protein